MLRISIIGCGKISDQHAELIQRIPGCEIVSVCDREELLAKQMQERFKIKEYYCDARELMEKSRPDIVHITTPPQSHFDLGKFFLDSGCHVYMEKPFTIDAQQAEQLISIAERRNLKITVGHNAQFTPAAREMRTLVSEGYLGGPPVHMDCYYCYNLGDPGYAKALLGDKDYWVRKLPGKLLQNVISHGISKIAEHLDDDRPEVIVVGFTSPILKSIGEDEIIDELRVTIKDKHDRTSFFTFSTSMKPLLHQLRLYGPKNSLIVDDDNQTVIRIRGDRRKSYLEQFISPFHIGKQYVSCSAGNISKFMHKKFHVNSGMKYLIESFYDAVNGKKELPIPYRQIILTSRLMDNIFSSFGSEEHKNNIARLN